jgi:inosine/xanthosine triphosphatase
MKILVASKNPVKINAVAKAFKICFTSNQEVEGVAVPSGVPDQPRSDGETRTGAFNRVENLIKKGSKADYYIGIEGGVDIVENRLFTFAWIAVSDGIKQNFARTGSFELPPEVARLIYSGMELGDANDKIFAKQNSKQENGAVGLLTRDILTREQLYQQAIILSLIPFLNKGLY